jgi:hypothetical protein
MKHPSDIQREIADRIKHQHTCNREPVHIPLSAILFAIAAIIAVIIWAGW